jgi:2,4-dienoyl-CoA reductase (NADPH2)
VDFPGHDHAKVIGYLDVLNRRVVPGKRVAIVGAGGIGFDVAEFLVQEEPSPILDPARWMAECGVDLEQRARGGLAPPQIEPPAREVWLLQRSPGRPGAKLGKSTGWIHRATLRAKGVKMVGGVEYLGVDDDGFRIRVAGAESVLPVDHVVICAGQESLRELAQPLRDAGREVHVIGGADLAVELDAKRAIDQGSRLAAIL